MSEAARIWTTVGANLAPLKAGLAEAGAATDRFGRSFGKTMASHTASMEKVGRSWRRNISMPLAATGIVAAKMAMDFQRQMTLIQTSAGASAKDVKELSKQVLDLARVTPYGPSELAKGLYHLKSLGYDNVTAMKTLKVAIKGAMVGGSDLESTTSALGAAIRTNIKGTGDYTKAMATLNGVVGAGNMRMDELIAALGTGVLPAAKTAGLSLRDVGAALALMTDEGMHADAAATRLRMTFSLMAAPSKAANKALAKIGLSGSQLGMAMQGPGGLTHALMLLRSHLDQLGDSDKIHKWAGQVDRGKLSLGEFQKMAAKTAEFDVLSHAFGGGRSAGAIEMMLNNLDVLKSKYAQIDSTTAHFKKNVEAANNTDLNKLKTSWSSIEVSLIKAGAAITPFVVKMASGLATLADGFSKLHSGTRKWLLLGSGALMMGGPLLIFTAKLIKALQVIRGLFVVEQAASVAATTKVTAGMAAQAAAADAAQASVLSLRAALLGIAGLGVISASIVIYELLKDRKKSNYTDIGSTGSGGVNQRYVVGADGSYHVVTHTANRGSQHGRDASPGEVNAATGLYTGTSGGGTGANDSPGRTRAIGYATAARARDAQRRMREALQKKAEADFNRLMKQTYGSTDYTPPGMGDLVGAGGGKGKVKTSKAKPVTNPLIAAAADYLGVPYVWGGGSPQGFDCSGFIQYLYKKFGIDLPHSSQQQSRVGKSVSLGMLKPGDLVFTNKHSDGPHHVGLYVGKGQVIESSGGPWDSAGHTRPGDQVKKISLAAFGAYEARRIANFSGSYGGTNTNLASYVKLADPKKIAADATTFRKIMREIDGMTGDEQSKAKSAMKKIGKSLVTILTPGDESSVKTKLAGMTKLISAAIDRMRKVVDAKKQTFSEAWGRLAAAGAAQLDKRLASDLAAIAAKYASGPKEDALAALDRQSQLDQLNQDLADAQVQYQQALAGGDPQQLQDAGRAVAAAQKAIARDQLEQQSEAEKTANEKSQRSEEDAANEKYDRLKQSFDDQVSAIERGMEDGSIATATGLSEIKDLFVSFGVDLKSQGPVIGGVIYDSITSGLIGATNAADDLADALRRLNLLTDTPAATSTSAVSGTAGAAGGFFALNPVAGRGSITGRARALANGGIVRHRPGGILAQIGEGGEDEAVMPLSSLGGDTYLTATIPVIVDGRTVSTQTHTELLRAKNRGAKIKLG